MYVPRNYAELIREGWILVEGESRWVMVNMCQCGWHTGLIKHYLEIVHVCPSCGDHISCFKKMAVWQERWLSKPSWWGGTESKIFYGYIKPVVECSG